MHVKHKDTESLKSKRWEKTEDRLILGFSLFAEIRLFPAAVVVIKSHVGGYVESAYDETRDLVYVLYEESAGEALHFAKFSLDELL